MYYVTTAKCNGWAFVKTTSLYAKIPKGKVPLQYTLKITTCFDNFFQIFTLMQQVSFYTSIILSIHIRKTC